MSCLGACFERMPFTTSMKDILVDLRCQVKDGLPDRAPCRSGLSPRVSPRPDCLERLDDGRGELRRVQVRVDFNHLNRWIELFLQLVHEGLVRFRFMERSAFSAKC